MAVTTLKEAEDAVLRHLLKQHGGRGEALTYSRSEVVETERWWYIPYGWIGCGGFIVNKEDEYVNQLGSCYIGRRDLSFWGHDHGLPCDLVDFTFSDGTDLGIARSLVSRFQFPQTTEGSEDYPRNEQCLRYTLEKLDTVMGYFPTFKRQFVWYALAELKEAYDMGVRFTTRVVK